MVAGVVPKLALALFAPAATCLVLCTNRVEPIHGWMMRHHCVFARWAMHPPSRRVLPATREPTRMRHAMP